MLTELSLLLIAYIGVFVGFILSKITGKEVSKGKESLKNLRTILFGVALFWFLYASDLNLMIKIIATIAVLTIAVTTDHMYATAGILFGLQPGFVMSSLLFLYGFPTGSLMQGKSTKDVFLATYGFLVFAMLSYAISKLVL